MSLALLEQRYPAIPWRTPIPVEVMGHGDPRLGCRICIALRGLHARQVAGLFKTVEEFEQHMKVSHKDS